ncbi:STAS domain-containing protein [Actinoplanes sp. NEAU-A12]|uniref:STAS domain-containing protein n=1 Tax=Actinoplanes sandaracinus TaxID=3045177 RepID=A0ABT6WQ30_9ACTN|nr:STAS domain-containing protein [Actinoplanes sandaracinus]MDI6101796.1 STAS domain-containing protein [Actinoplanes sandaracinus]
MTDPRYEIERDTRRTGSTVHLRLIGAFDRDAHRVLRLGLRDVFASGRRGHRVFVDMERAESIGSECIELLLVGYTRALRSGHGYEIVNAHGHVRQALALTGLCEPEVAHPAWSDDLIATSTP